MPRRNTILRRQARKIIYNVTQFMKKEKEEGVMDVKSVHLRVAKATGISERTVRRILVEGTPNEMISVFRTPGKKRVRAKPITGIDSFDQGVIKRCIHNFHETEKQMVTIKKLLDKLKNDLNFEGGQSSLRKIVKNLGFKWRQTETNRKVLIEKTDIRLKRIDYLNKIKKYRDEGRPIVYMDESYVHSTHTKNKSWSDGSTKGLKRPISKGQRIVIVHAGSEAGFVPNALLMFKSGAKTGDYHDDMNFTNYVKWIQTQLIPNLNPNSIVVMDNAPYHNKLSNPAPTSNSRKAEMELWLNEKGVPYDATMHKPELYNLIKQHKDTHKQYVVDNIFAQHSHTVLRLPPYHPDLNPIEMAWAAVKGYVAAKNVTWNVNDTMKLIEEKVEMMGQEEWGVLCRKVKEVENEYRRSDHVIDEMTERFIIRVGTEDSSESDSDSDSDSDINDEEEEIPSTSAGPSNFFMEGISTLPTSDSD